MTEIIDFTEKRLEKNPVRYTVHFNHDEQGFWIEVEGLSHDPKSNERLGYYMWKAAAMIESRPPRDEDDREDWPDNYQDVEHAIRIAELWRDGKMIGGDEYRIMNTLLDEIARLRAAQQ